MRKILAVSLFGMWACAGSAIPDPKPYGEVHPSVTSNLVAALKDHGGGQEVRVAMLPLEAEGEVSQLVGQLLADDIAAQIAADNAITFVDRAKMTAVIEEMALQQSGLVNESDQIQMGKLAGAQVLVTLRTTLVGEAVQVAVRAVVVETSVALTGTTVAIDYGDDLKATLADYAARMNVRTSKEVLEAFGDLRAGDLADAEKVFDELSKGQGERRSVGVMGQAAIAYERDQSARATELCQVSQELSDKPSYCWVIDGRIAYEQGDFDKATAGLTRALNDAGTLIDWQKALAANTLGLIAMAKKNPDNAVVYYDKAIALDPTNAEALSNKARMLEQGGDLATAVALYQRGAKADPNDKVLGLLLRDAEMRLNFAKDEARQHKISELASELIANADKGAQAKRDPWTSTPVAVNVLPLEEKGSPAKRMGETAFLESALRNSVGDVSGMEVVDRQLLSSVLGELQLSSSSLGDESTALKVGKVVAARVLLGGSVVRMEGEAQITLKLIETETTRVLGQVNEIFEAGDRLSKVSDTLAQALTGKLKELFPVRGRVTKKKGGRVQADIGSAVGVAVGDTFTVFGAKDDAALGKATVLEVNDASAWLEVTEGGKKVRKGARLARLH